MITQRNDNLTKAEELELGELIQKGVKARAELESSADKLTKDEREALELISYDGDNAYEKLVGNYFNLARDIAHKHHKRTGTRYAIEDIMQDAILALCEAAYSYDPSKNCKLGTHAFYAITKKVSTRINEARLVRMPENRMGQYLQIIRAERAYGELENPEMTEREYVIEHAEVTPEEYTMIKTNMQPSVSLNAVVKDSEREMGDLIEDSSQSKLPSGAWGSAVEADEVSLHELNTSLTEILKKLNPFEQDLIAFEFGAYKPSMSFDEFLVKYDMTDKDVIRLTRRTIRKMKKIAEGVH